MFFDAVTFSRCGCFRFTAQKLWEVTGTNGPCVIHVKSLRGGGDTQTLTAVIEFV